MKNNLGLVSIIIPCFNSEKYIAQALESIIQQTYKNIEVICINDASTDTTLTILENYKKKDHRIQVYSNVRNSGIVFSLNKAINIAKGEFIARMDSDDISLPKRIETQILFLLNQNLDICSSNAIYIDSKNNFLGYCYKYCHEEALITFSSFFGSPFIHPAVFSRSSVLKKYLYEVDENTNLIEDYSLWSKMIRENIKMGFVQQYLIFYRINEEGISISKKNNQLHQSHKQALRNINFTLNKNFILYPLSNIKSYKEIKLNFKSLDELYLEYSLNKSESQKQPMKLMIFERKLLIISNARNKITKMAFLYILSSIVIKSIYEIKLILLLSLISRLVCRNKILKYIITNQYTKLMPTLKL